MFRAAGVPSRGFPFLHYGSTGFPSPYGSFSVLEFTGQVRGDEESGLFLRSFKILLHNFSVFV